MNLNFENKGDKLVIHMLGELDHHSAEEVRNKIDDRVERDNCYNLILDFSGVTFMDSSGIGVVIGRYKKLLRSKGKLYITKVNGSVKRVFELSGMFKIIPLYDSIEQALENM
ncbi:anti-sigma F factor antagonist [Clostridium sp. MB40-C1]|uniref:anti-sigma F factor antagonist n=1 Tax=Clostridium sp. MB40-C1 TaxID=3070996 RepID=UPI0027DF438F|nr:anti-sigma F factor antagonist [Clostridium sp. MB40-C1]WMJ81200.1 anti-sigma F factor antagonist [Clostridium sp. MB40-C1]